MTLAEEYQRQVIAHMRSMGEKLFPEQSMDEFERTSREMIDRGENKCPCGAATMERIYPVGNHWNNGWICPRDAQEMWQEGILRNCVVFNMTKEPA